MRTGVICCIKGTRDADGVFINLASREYAKAVEKYIAPADHFITVEFCEQVDGKLKQKGTFAKMARARWYASWRAAGGRSHPNAGFLPGWGIGLMRMNRMRTPMCLLPGGEKEKKKHHALSDAPANIGFG